MSISQYNAKGIREKGYIGWRRYEKRMEKKAQIRREAI